MIDNSMLHILTYVKVGIFHPKYRKVSSTVYRGEEGERRLLLELPSLSAKIASTLVLLSLTKRCTSVLNLRGSKKFETGGSPTFN